MTSSRIITFFTCALLLSACAAPNEYKTYDTNKASSYTTKAEDSSMFKMEWPDLTFWDVEEDPALTIEEPVMKKDTPPEMITLPAGRVD